MDHEFVKKGLKTLGQYKYLLIIAAAGIVLLLLPNFSGKTQEVTAQEATPEFSLEQEEARISRVLSSVAGLGKTEVILTLKSTMETVYQDDVKDTSDSTAERAESSLTSETVVISAGAGTEQAVVLKKIYPEYRGALIVCEGASSASVQLKVINAVRSLTGLPADKITVLSKRGNA